MKTTLLKRILAFSLVIGGGILVSSCEKDLNINADYEAYPIIYGLMNPYDSIQTVRINKSFLGEEDPSGYARIEDSSLFKEVLVDLVEYSDGYELARYPLTQMTVTGKDSGLFAYPDQRVYGAQLPKVLFSDGSESIKYLKSHVYAGGELVNRIKYTIEGTLDGRKIKAEMAPVPEEPSEIFYQRAYSSKWSTSAKAGSIAFATSSRLTEGLVMTTDLPPLTKIAELKMIFNYQDVYLNGDVVNMQIEQSMGQKVVPSVSETRQTEHDFFMSSERFYELIKTQVPDFDPNVLKERIPGIVDFQLILGDAEYYYYRENTLPSDDLNQLKPQYTNVENGFGIFASRLEVVMSEWAIGTQPNINSVDGLPGLLLEKWTQRALNQGYIENATNGEITELGTAAKGFCVDPTVDGNAGNLRCN